MTKDKNRSHEREIPLVRSDDANWTLGDNAGPGVKRRTIVKGAAWSIPVIAVAVATPLAAASATSLVLEFLNGPYSASACGPLADIVLLATTDGTTPAVGAQVTVTLPTGLTWSDGTTASRAFITDGNGNVNVSGLLATSANGTVPITATSGSVNASGIVNVAPSDSAFQYNNVGSVTSAIPNSQPGSTPVGGGYYLAPNGDLYNNGGSLIDTGVSFAIGNYDAQSASFVGYSKNGVVYQANGTNTPLQIPNVPTGATPVGGGFWLAPNGDLYRNNGTVIATGVTSAVGGFASTVGGFVGYVANGATFQYNVGGGTLGNPSGTFPQPNVPTNSTPVGGGYYLAPNGDLYENGNGGTLVASNVTEAKGAFDSVAGRFVGFVSNGVTFQHNSGNGAPGSIATNPIPNVPAGSTPVIAFYLAPNGDLYNNAGTVVATNVLKAAGGYTQATGAYVGFTKSAC